MRQATVQREIEGVAERRAQRQLTDRVAVRLVRRSRWNNLKWSTWRRRAGIRGTR
jgi:hypothetical protein